MLIIKYVRSENPSVFFLFLSKEKNKEDLVGGEALCNEMNEKYNRW